jgi:hypothetical protein
MLRFEHALARDFGLVERILACVTVPRKRRAAGGALPKDQKISSQPAMPRNSWTPAAVTTATWRV